MAHGRLFFFSSRRRHTRCSRDWSSDVCSSDLHKLPLAAADSLTPHFAWAAFLKDAGAPATQALNIGQPRFFSAVDSLLTTVPLDDWRAYLRWHAARHLSPWLSARFVDANFQFQR